jgi:hypothetical protein
LTPPVAMSVTVFGFLTNHRVGSIFGQERLHSLLCDFYWPQSQVRVYRGSLEDSQMRLVVYWKWRSTIVLWLRVILAWAESVLFIVIL